MMACEDSSITNLWSAVLRLAVIDYSNKKIGWRYFFTPDFYAVCELAQADPRAVRDLARAHIHQKTIVN